VLRENIREGFRLHAQVHGGTAAAQLAAPG
jgi:hypothetical protein